MRASAGLWHRAADRKGEWPGDSAHNPAALCSPEGREAMAAFKAPFRGLGVPAAVLAPAKSASGRERAAQHGREPVLHKTGLRRSTKSRRFRVGTKRAWRGACPA